MERSVNLHSWENNASVWRRNFNEFLEAIEKKPPAWHQKSRELFIACFLLLIATVTLFTVFALTGLLVVPFIAAVPITFAVYTFLIGIKIVIDNQAKPPATELPDNPPELIQQGFQQIPNASHVMNQPGKTAGFHAIKENEPKTINEVFEEFKRILEKNAIKTNITETLCKNTLEKMHTDFEKHQIDLSKLFT